MADDYQPKALTIADLPRQQKPGDVGIRVDSDGGIWIPLGGNVGARDRVGRPYYAQIQRRRDWHEAKTLGGKRSTGTRVSLVKCSVCKFLIGRGFIETEVYARPVLVSKENKDTLAWKKVCGDCAVRYFDLPHGFCVLADPADWTSEYTAHLNRKAFRMVWDEKVAQLQDRLSGPMFDFILRAEQIHWHQHRGNLTHFHRQPILEKWVAIQQPPVETFSDLYYQLMTSVGGTHHAVA